MNAFRVHNSHRRTPLIPRLTVLAGAWLFFGFGFRLAADTSEAQQYNSRTWNTGEGLPSNSVQAIAQTSDGYLWIGTREGLARFDGVQFTVFNSKNTPQIKNSSINALYSDRQGSLWIGSDGGGLICLNNGNFTLYTKTNGLAGDVVKSIYEGPDDSKWIGTSTGMSRFKDGKFVNYTRLYFTHKPSLISSFINSICGDREGNLWVATSGGLNRLKDESVDLFTTADGLPNNTLRTVFEDREGRLWIGTTYGIAQYEHNSFHSYNVHNGLSDNFVTSICEDRDGNIWVGTYGGLSRYVNGVFFTQLNNEGEPFDQVNAVFEDREGSIWVASKEGLIQLSPKQFVAYTRRQGLSHNNVMSVLEGRDGSLWTGTWGGGLNRFKDGKFATVDSTRGVNASQILATCQARDGSIWAGAEYDGGLYHLKDGKVARFTSKQGLVGAGIKVLCEDTNGALWIGTGRGLNCFKNDQFTTYTTTNSHLPGNMIRAIREDHAGRLWIGTDGGLCHWENGDFINESTNQGLSDPVINALYEDRESNLWVGTDSGGLNCLDGRRSIAFTTRQGLYSDRILEIVEDNHGWLWMTCYKGIFRVQKKNLDDLAAGRVDSLTCIVYGKADGMESAQCNGVAKPAAWKAQDGRLWFPTTKGLVVTDPNRKLNEVPPPLLINEIFADRKKIDREKSSRADSSDPVSKASPELIVPPGSGELEFHYTTLSFLSPDRDRFRYKLEGVDSSWVDAGTHRIAHYNNIYPGRYRFLVQAANNDGIWNDTGTAVTVILRPHFWQSQFFIIPAVLGVLVLVGGAVRYFTWIKVHRKLVLLELQHTLEKEREKERARIARDIHDDLGATLTQITLLSDRSKNGVAEDLQANTRKISATAREMARSLDEIVWAINPEHDTLEGLVEYLTQSADEFLEDTAIRSRIKVPTPLPSHVISAEMRHDLFLAFKEALNNSVRHARAAEINIEFVISSDHFQIEIVDNGAGFEPASVAGGGNGLKNMRSRLASIGGRFELSSQPGHGTSIKLAIPLRNSAPFR